MRGHFMNSANIVNVIYEDQLIGDAAALQNLQWRPLRSRTQRLKGIDG